MAGAFQPPATSGQRTSDALFGIVAPTLCLVYDPIVFISLGPVARGWLPLWRPILVPAIIVGMALLGIGLIWPRWRTALSTLYLLCALISLVVGVAILPISLLAIALAGIGLLGLAPFVTTWIFVRNAVQGRREQAAGGRAATPLAIAGVLVLAAWAGVVWQWRADGIARISAGDVAAGMTVLKRIPFNHEYPDVVAAYDAATGAAREHLSAAYRELTGGSITDTVD